MYSGVGVWEKGCHVGCTLSSGLIHPQWVRAGQCWEVKPGEDTQVPGTTWKICFLLHLFSSFASWSPWSEQLSAATRFSHAPPALKPNYHTLNPPTILHGHKLPLNCGVQYCVSATRKLTEPNTVAHTADSGQTVSLATITAPALLGCWLAQVPIPEAQGRLRLP